MRNILIVAAIVVVFLNLSSCDKSVTSSSNVNRNTYVEQQVNLEDMGKIKYSISDLDTTVMEYLKNVKYKDVPKDKKMIRAFTGARCPYGKEFENALKQAKTKYRFYNNYYFQEEDAGLGFSIGMSQDGRLNNDFESACHEFCIINWDKGQIFAINGIGTEEAKQLEYILLRLDDNW